MKKNYGLALCVLAFSLISCEDSQKKNDEENNKKENDYKTFAVESATAEILFKDLSTRVIHATAEIADSLNNSKSFRKGSYSFTRGGITYTVDHWDLTTFPKQITINYGTSGVQGSDGHHRRGSLTYTITDWYTNEGCTITVIPNNFYIDYHKLAGTQNIVNNGRNNDGFLAYSLNVQNGIITKPDNTQFSWNSERVHVWIEGEATLLNSSDDVYSITGWANGTTSENVAYNLTIVKPLNWAVNCKWIRGGNMTGTYGSFSNIVIDYGNNSCDGNATITVLAAEIPFVMP